MTEGKGRVGHGPNINFRDAHVIMMVALNMETPVKLGERYECP